MKILLTFFVLFFSSSVLAEDISDFQIEGMSVGDSLLDYLSEEDILRQIKQNVYMYDYLKEPEKFGHVNIYSGLTQFSYIAFYVSPINKKYIIEGINATLESTIDSNYELDDCLKKMKEVEKVFSQMFNDYQKFGKNNIDHPIDSTGRSKVHYIKFLFDTGDNAQIQCFDFEEKLRKKNNWSDGLAVIVRKNEVSKWLQDR